MIAKNKFRISALVVFSCIVLFTVSCVDPIPFEVEDDVPKLVIFGSFTQLSQDHEVTIRRTSEFGSLGFPVTAANVEIVNMDGTSGNYIEIEEGRYVLSKNEICGEPGKSYKLVVTLPGGQRYESSWEEMPQPVFIEKTDFDVEFRQQLSNSNNLIRQFFIDILINTPLRTINGDKAFLRWEIDESYALLDFQCGPFDKAEICFYEVNQDFDQLRIFSSLDESQERIENYRVYSRLPTPFLEFSEKHYFNVLQHSISESTFDFWKRIEVVSNPTGSIFDKIPAGVKGNMESVNGEEEVLGLFEVAAVTVGRVFTTPEKLGEDIQIIEACNPYFPAFFQPDYCCFCFLLPNRIPRPEYWGE